MTSLRVAHTWVFAFATMGALVLFVTSCSDRDSEDLHQSFPGKSAQHRQRQDSIAESLPLPSVTISSARADLDGDVALEEVELLADVELDPDGEPLWEDGHRWVVLVRDDAMEYRVVDEFVPQGRLSGWIVEPEEGSPVVVVLKESGTGGIELWAFRHAGQGGYAPVGGFDGSGRLVARFTEGEIAPAE
jgi:hypothetical protein